MSDEKMWSAQNILAAILAVGFFVLAIDLLGGSLNELAGGVVAPIIDATANPFIGLFIGLLMTAILQSSSTTTSLAVAAVAAGSINLESAIPIILGANVGTTITSTIIAFGFITKSNEFRKAVSAAMIHDMFNILGVLIVFPLELRYNFLQKASTAISTIMPIGTTSEESSFWFGRTMDFVSDGLLNLIGAFPLLVVSVLLLFGSIKIISNLLYKQLVGKRQQQFRNTIFRNPPLAFGWGLAITSVVQSSSLTTSLIVPLVATGKVRLARAFQFLMGANIGTTITAILAALFRSEAAMSLAVAHFLFNTVVVLIFVGIPIIGKLPLYLAERLGLMLQRYRAAAIAYLTLTFFAIPFSLIYFSNGDEVVEQRQQRQKVEVTKD